MSDKKVIFSMVKVNKTTPQGKHILKNIYLSFFYGAKIGIIGLNGSGKSTVMKIIAGLDEKYQGDVVWSDDGYTVGYLPQEPELDPTKTVREIVEEGVPPMADLLVLAVQPLNSPDSDICDLTLFNPLQTRHETSAPTPC